MSSVFELGCNSFCCLSLSGWGKQIVLSEVLPRLPPAASRSSSLLGVGSDGCKHRRSGTAGTPAPHESYKASFQKSSNQPQISWDGCGDGCLVWGGGCSDVMSWLC